MYKICFKAFGAPYVYVLSSDKLFIMTSYSNFIDDFFATICGVNYANLYMRELVETNNVAMINIGWKGRKSNQTTILSKKVKTTNEETHEKD